jgi:putative PIN family toxin of toxin-antitoxin system
MKIVLDTNVLISGIFWEGNESKILKACKTEDLINYISPEILNEFYRVLLYPKFKLSSDEIESALETVIKLSNIVNPEIKIDIIKDDPIDNIFIECAITANANYIVSGDKHLLKLKEFKGIQIANCRKIIDDFDHLFD